MKVKPSECVLSPPLPCLHNLLNRGIRRRSRVANRAGQLIKDKSVLSSFRQLTERPTDHLTQPLRECVPCDSLLGWSSRDEQYLTALRLMMLRAVQIVANCSDRQRSKSSLEASSKTAQCQNGEGAIIRSKIIRLLPQKGTRSPMLQMRHDPREAM